jgi:hypothetical protein
VSRGSEKPPAAAADPPPPLSAAAAVPALPPSRRSTSADRPPAARIIVDCAAEVGYFCPTNPKTRTLIRAGEWGHHLAPQGRGMIRAFFMLSNDGLLMALLGC